MTDITNPDKVLEVLPKNAISNMNEGRWHQNPSILISVLALLSSTALGIYMAVKSFDENFHVRKVALRSTLTELMDVDEKSADLMRDMVVAQNSDPNNNIAFSTYLNSKSLALANRRAALLEYARILLEELGEAVTPVEYAVLGAAYQNAGRLDLAEKYYLSLAKSNIPYFKASAYRSLGGINAITSNGMNTSSSSYYKEALAALNGQNDTHSIAHKSYIYLEWAKYTSMYCKKAEALEMLNKAQEVSLSLPTINENRKILLRQIGEIQNIIDTCSENVG